MANNANLEMFVPGNCKMGGDRQHGWPALIGARLVCFQSCFRLISRLVLKKCLVHEIPECSQQLSGLTIEQPVHLNEDEESSEDYMYVTGYLDHYTPTAWDTWLKTFQLQTSTQYSIRQGKQPH